MRALNTFTVWYRLAAVLMMAAALSVAPAAVHAADDFLDPEVAFRFDAKPLDAKSVEVSFAIAPGYYLYREQFRFAAEGATLGEPVIPAGKVKFDETFQKNVETYRDVIRIVVPVQQASPRFTLAVTSQGCADKGLCYPPRESRAEVGLTGFGGDGSIRLVAAASGGALSSGAALSSSAAATAPTPSATSTTSTSTDSAGIDAALRGGRFWTVVGVFFLAGVLLSLTPCVLPMLPILSSIIVGQGHSVTRSRGLALAASYSLGMALVYTAFGVAAGLAGVGLAAALQNPWVLGTFALGLVALAVSMFGVYELQLPAALTGRLTEASQQLPAGRMASVFAMGGVSALIVSPCVAAPLAGALVYLSQTRDVLLGGTALFSLAAGMSIPLLLVGASAGTLLPRAGAWMDGVKRLFGLMLLAVALYTVQPVLPSTLALALWGALLIGAAVVALAGGAHAAATAPGTLLRKSGAAVLALLGTLQLVGAASGGTDPLQPLGHLRGGGAVAASHGPVFGSVRSVAELDAALRSAGRPVMLDFYADWCVSCKEMERFTFTDAAVQAKLSNALLLKADVTKNDDDDRALLKRFSLFGPPGTIFFGADGRELQGTRAIGFQKAEEFLVTLQRAGL
ncbi:protein-disulfide reductase DsbD [Rhizobacter sp. P5_C2]